MFKTAIQMLWVEKKKTMNLCFSITIAICINIIFLHFINNPYLSIDEKAATTITGLITQSSQSVLAFTVLTICVCLVVYSCNYYIRVHSREIGLVKLAGYNFFKLVLYQIIQIFIITLIAYVIALISSIVLIPIIQKIVYSYLGIQQNIYVIFPITIFQSFLIVCILIVIMTLSQTQYSIQNNIPNLLKQHTIVSYKQTNSAFKMSDMIYIIFYLLGITTMYMEQKATAGIIIPASIGAIASYGIFYHCIPKYFRKKIDTKEMKAEKYLIFGDVILFLQQSKLLILFIMLSIIIFPSLLLITNKNSALHIQIHLAFILISVLLNISLVNRFKISHMEKERQYQNIYRLGFIKEEVLELVSQEIKLIYLLIWSLTGIYVINIILSLMIKNKIELYMIILITIEFVLPYIVSRYIVLKNTKKEVIIL